MSGSIGSQYGLIRRATIIRYNNDGTVQIRIDESGGQQPLQEYRVPMPLAWAGPNGEFIGGFPTQGSSVIVKQSQGGQWFIESYIPSRNSFSNSEIMQVIKPGRAVMQVKDGSRIFLEPKIGIQAGNAEQFLHINPKQEIISHNFSMEMAFTEASRSIDGIIKRDLKENSNRGVVGSTLTSHAFDQSLYPIAMDPTGAASVSSMGEAIRNPALVESRKTYYEFADSFDVGTDEEEAARVNDPRTIPNKLNNGKKESRADLLSLGLDFPNHLIEVVYGTVVDSFGNVLDLNRNPLPIGKVDEISLRKNPKKSEAYSKIRQQYRKSIAFHWELNARKDTSGEFGAPEAVPEPDDVSNYARNRSRAFVDMDKEGVFKINIPASSETGNIPLLTRYESYSTLISKQDSSVSPNDLVRNKDNQDIYLDSFAGKASVKLTGSDSDLDGFETPMDRVTNKPMKLGTAFHDITKVCGNFLPGAPKMILYEDNPLLALTPYDKIVESSLTVSGEKANAGGRSGLFSTDGMLSINLGANTSDRQSLWFDCAGGIVSMLGRDKRGISYAAHLDGDMIIQLGGPGIGNAFDSRFADQNDGARIGALDIRIINGDRPTVHFRLDKQGIRMATEGVLELVGQQGVVISTNGQCSINAERLAFFANTGLVRQVERNGIPV